MKIAVWLFLILLILSFTVAIVQQITARVQPDQKYEVCRVEAEALTGLEQTLSWFPFGLLYLFLCTRRWRGVGPVERLLLSILLTVGLFGFVFWAWMNSKFHSYPDCANAPLPFGTFLSAWTSPLFGIGLVIVIGLVWNSVRVSRVAPREA